MFILPRPLGRNLYKKGDMNTQKKMALEVSNRLKRHKEQNAFAPTGTFPFPLSTEQEPHQPTTPLLSFSTTRS